MGISPVQMAHLMCILLALHLWVFGNTIQCINNVTHSPIPSISILHTEKRFSMQYLKDVEWGLGMRLVYLLKDGDGCTSP